MYSISHSCHHSVDFTTRKFFLIDVLNNTKQALFIDFVIVTCEEFFQQLDFIPEATRRTSFFFLCDPAAFFSVYGGIVGKLEPGVMKQIHNLV
jgi:hypothetical protein